MSKKKIDWRVLCVGLICLTGLEIFALSLGYNGTGLKIVLVIIALGIGITIPTDILKILKGRGPT